MSIGEDFKTLFANAAQTVLERGSRLQAIASREEIVRGVSLMPLPDHTAGHCVVRIASAKEELFYVADCFHDQAFDLDHPDWRTAFDFSPALAAETRRALLDRAATDGAALMAFHMPFPGLGHVASSAK